MTDIKTLVERLKELEAKASPGPWFSLVTDMYTRVDSNQGKLADLQYPNDIALIVGIRNALPELLKELQDLLPTNKILVTEMCSWCGEEASFYWNIQEYGNYNAYCPHCGSSLMLCSECDIKDNCDWSNINEKCQKSW